MWKKNQVEFEKPYVSAIIPAAGSASRMQGIDKLFEEILDIPVIIYTLSAFQQSDWIDEIVLVVRQGDIADMMALIKEFELTKVKSVLCGGSSRQQSVLAGLEAVSAQAEYIAVHDGDRPLVTQQIIADCVIDAVRYQACAAAVPVINTIKIADEDGLVECTPDRSKLYMVQTPQVFQAQLYRDAAAAAKDAGEDYTDDCQMIEKLGGRIHLSKGDYENIKLTTPVDILTVQAIFLMREEEQG